jgi:dihydroxyacid dehydratase/phosphogluconate dehydratase
MTSDKPRLPHDQPTDPAKRVSAALTDGPDRAAAHGMLKAIGFTDEDLAKPIVGVATSWIETMPCNYNQRRLAEFAKEGVRAAGGTPMEFNTIAISDGVSMGTEGMKASLISREVVADSKDQDGGVRAVWVARFGAGTRSSPGALTQFRGGARVTRSP